LDVAIRTLQSNNILSVPVSSATTTQLRGFIDMLDIVYFAQTNLNVLHGESDGRLSPSGTPRHLETDKKMDISSDAPDGSEASSLPRPPSAPVTPQLSTADAELKKATLADVIKALGREAVEIQETHSTYTLVEVFTSGDRRAAILSRDKKAILGIMSQSDVVRHVSPALQKGGALSEFGQLSIKELGHGLKPVVAVQKKQTVAFALKLLVEKKVSSLAVVDEPKVDAKTEETALGKLVGNFSASDFRFITHDHFRKFKVTTWRVDTFLGSVHHHSLVPTTIRPDDSLTKVVELLVLHSLHHIWIADEEGRPIGIVSLTDVMKMLLSYAKRSSTTP